MNFISSVNLNPCCKEMLEGDDKLRHKSDIGTKKTCPTCKSINALVGGQWVRPTADNPDLERFPADQERETQGLTSHAAPAVAAFEKGLEKAEKKAANIETKPTETV